MGRAKNQVADALASECLKEAMVGAIKLQRPKLQGKESLQDVLSFLETGEPPPGLTKGERRWLARKAVRYRLIKDDLSCQGKDQVLWKAPPSGDIHQILHSCHNDVCGGNFAQDITCRKVLQASFVWPSLQPDAQFWCKTCDVFVNAQDLGNLFMDLNSLSLPLGLLRNGALMPLVHSQGQLCRKRVHPCGCTLHDEMGRSFTNKPDYSQGCG